MQSNALVRLDHLRRMTDQRGLIHAALDDCPDRLRGYHTLDNIEALRLCALASDTVSGECMDALAKTYFTFLKRGQRDDSRLHHWCNAAGVWLDEQDDALLQSRLARALSAVIVSELPIDLRLEAARWWSELIVHAEESATPVSMANWLLALGTLRAADPGRDLALATRLAKKLADDCYRASRGANWEWFEKSWSAGGAVMAAAMWQAYDLLGDAQYGQIANVTTTFIIDHLYVGNVLMPVGTRGGWSRGQEKALFDQMPEEAASIVELCRIAEKISGNPSYHDYATRAADWFAGKNMTGLNLLDGESGGCHARLRADGLDRNLDAPATLAYLLARAALAEPTRVESTYASHIVIG